MDIEMPDGTVIEDVPEGITQSELARRFGLHVQSQQSPTYSPAVEAKARADIAAQPLGQDVSIPQQIGEDLKHGAQASWGHVLSALLSKQSPAQAGAKDLIAKQDLVTAPTVGSIPELAVTAPLASGLIRGAGEGAAALVDSPIPKLIAGSLGRIAGGGATGAGLAALNTAGTDQNTGNAALGGFATGALLQGGLGELPPAIVTAGKAILNKTAQSLANSPEVQLNQQFDNLVNETGRGGQTIFGPQSPVLPTEQEAAAAVSDRFRPALERYGLGLGKNYDEFYNGKQIVVDPAKDPQFASDIQAAISNEEKQANPDPNFIRTAKKFLVGEVPNPEIDAALKGQNPRAQEQLRQGLIRSGIPEFIKVGDIPFYDAATGTIPGDVAQANVTRFGELASSREAAHSKQGYGALNAALRGAQARSLTPADQAQLEALNAHYKYFKRAEEATSDSNVALLELFKSGNQEAIDRARNILDQEDLGNVRENVGASLISDLNSATRGNRPSQAVNPKTFESALNKITPEARREYLPQREMQMMEQLASAPPTVAQRIGKKLVEAGYGFGGAAVGSTVGHPFVGYGIGHLVGESKSDAIVRALMNKQFAPVTETAPWLSGQVTPALISALTGGSQ